MIAQRPANPRDSSRLLVLDRGSGSISHHNFRDLTLFLSPGDALVLNQTRVIPARLPARKIPSGGRAELLLLKQLAPQTWETLVGGKGLHPGRELSLSEGITGEILEDLGGARRVVRFNQPISLYLERIGEMPLPPYIHTPLQCPDEYQTVFARQPGSSAAPTAGLHFTPQLLAQIEDNGVEVVKITLHVGLDTFAPVTEDNPQEHLIHREWCQVTPAAAEAINAVRTTRGRIVAVGTTTVRTLETAVMSDNSSHTVTAYEGSTDLFILPGFQFRVAEVMLTNFHLPHSTLLMMVSAFAGRERVLEAYEIAKREGYRFYSFGDAMLIL